MKKLNSVANTIISIGGALWVTETIVFLVLQGWHLKATDPTEILCDKMVSWIIYLGAFLWLVSAKRLVDKAFGNS